MALGGGTYTTQNKVLPGAYINFVSAASASATLSGRGIAAMPLELDWGPEGEIFTVTASDFQKNSVDIFGYDYNSPKLKGLRDLFLNASELIAYRLNSGGMKASNDYAEALYAGERGNDIKITISVNADDDGLYDVKTLLGTSVVDTQTVSSSAELVSNSYVSFKTNADLTVTAASSLTGGLNGEVTGQSHQDAITAFESYSFNCLGVDTTDDSVKALYASFVKRMRDEAGVKFQVVLYKENADYMGCINVMNAVKDEDMNESAAVYWVTGAEAGCAVNKSLTNTIYSGEMDIDVSLSQSELEVAINNGKFAFHRVGSDIRVLVDINSMVTTSDDQGEIFKENQTIRVIDQIGNDIATLFNTKYLGSVPNDKSGRLSLQSDVVKYMNSLADIRAIEAFSDSNVTVEQGNKKGAVVIAMSVTIVNAMMQLYMTVTIS